MKKILLTFLFVLCTTDSSLAVSIPGVMKQSLATDYAMPSLFQLVFSMIFVIALIYVTGWIYSKLNIVNRKRLGKIASDQIDSARFTVIQSMPLGQQRYLYTIEMNEKILLIGSTPSHINLIKEFDKVPLSCEISNETELKKETDGQIRKEIDIDEIYKKYKN